MSSDINDKGYRRIENDTDGESYEEVEIRHERSRNGYN